MRRQEEGDSSSNPESQDSEDSLEPSDCETDHKVGRLGGLHIKVERYGDGKVEELQDLPSSCSSEEEEDEVEDIIKDCNSGGELSGPAMSKHQKRKKRRKKQKWDGSRQRLRLSPSAAATPSPGSLDPTLGDQPPLLLPPSPTSSSVLKIKTEMSEPINFDNDSSIWNYPPNREISRNESPYSMTKPHDTFPSTPPAGLQVSIPDSVLTPPGTEGGGGSRKPNFNGNSSSGNNNSAPHLCVQRNSGQLGSSFQFHNRWPTLPTSLGLATGQAAGYTHLLRYPALHQWPGSPAEVTSGERSTSIGAQSHRHAYCHEHGFPASLHHWNHPICPGRRQPGHAE